MGWLWNLRPGRATRRLTTSSLRRSTGTAGPKHHPVGPSLLAPQHRQREQSTRLTTWLGRRPMAPPRRLMAGQWKRHCGPVRSSPVNIRDSAVAVPRCPLGRIAESFRVVWPRAGCKARHGPGGHPSQVETLHPACQRAVRPGTRMQETDHV